MKASKILSTVLALLTCAALLCGMAPMAVLASASAGGVAVGDIVRFGHYEQDNETANGSEAIEWIVLDNDGKTATLISRYGLDYQPYNHKYSADTVSWADCSLRQWLNADFISAAFSKEEQAHLQPVRSAAPEDGIEGTLRDRATLLCLTELKNLTAGVVACQATAYANALGARDNAPLSGNCDWWLSSRGMLGYYAATALDNGNYSSSGRPVYYSMVVRPVIRLKQLDTAFGSVGVPTPTPAPDPALLPLGTHYYFGRYEQDNNSGNGPEPIVWIVVANDGETVTLISEYALDCKPFNTQYKFANWESCSLRKWLNNDFFNAAFSAEEQAYIPAATVPADVNPYSQNHTIDYGKSTKDRVYLLSVQEVDRLYDAINDIWECEPTAYAKARGSVIPIYETHTQWWLRTPALVQTHKITNSIMTAGGVCDPSAGKDVDNATISVRPVIRLRRKTTSAAKTAPATQPKNKGTNATSPPSVEAQIKTWNSTGDEYYNKKDYAKAAEYYRPAANQGSAYAQDKLGYMFQYGMGVAQDYVMAVKYYQMAADQGYGYAQASLGSMYYYARGVAQDYTKAAKYYQMAANQGIAYAQYNTGIMYEYGKGVAKNSDTAAKYYQMAADQGYKDAQKKLKKYPKYYKVIRDGEYNGFKYCIYNYGEAEITDWNRTRTDTSVSIPSTIEGCPVTSIREEAFAWSGLTSVIIPDSVTSIGNGAFRGCARLTNIIIPGSVASFGDLAFFSCDSLAHVTISDGVNKIGNNAFCDCKRLTNVIIPDSVTTIGSFAFAGTGLTSVIIPDSVTSIGNDAFSFCSSLKSVNIPRGVTSILEDTFCYCDGLKSVTLPNNLTGIGESAFQGCKNLTSITIPNSVTTIDDAAFAYCESLKSVTIPGSVTRIGKEAFYRCDSLTNLTIPSSVSLIGTDAFEQSKKILTLTVTRGSYAETYCKKHYLKYKTN